MDTMGERLLALRRKKGITQEDLAEKLAVSRQSISNWELNKTLPDTDKLFALAKIYEVSLDYMVFGIEAKKEKAGKTGTKKETEKDIEKEIEKGKETEEDLTAEQSGSKGKKSGFIFRLIQMAGLLLCIGMTVVCAVFTIRLILRFATDSDQMNSDIVQINQIIEQYSYVEVSKLDHMGNYAKDRVWLDTRDLSNGEMIFCFTDPDNPKRMKFEYYSKTLIVPLGVTCLFLFLDGILAFSYYQNRKRKKG